MSKQSANRNNKQRQANGKPANNATSQKAQTPAKPSQTSAQANAPVIAKPSVQAEPQVGTMASAKPAQPSAKTATATATRQSGKQQQQRRTQKVQNRLEQQRIDARNRRVTFFSIAVAIVLVGALIGYFVWQNNSSSGTLAQAQTVVDPNHQPIDGVYCDASEQLAYHIHALLTIYIDGQNVPLSTGIGIDPGTTPSCYYWIHTHDATGVIHIESPTTRTYSLKQFFDIWQTFQSSSITFPTQLSSSTGWTVYVNGKQVNTDFNHLQLTAHELITIAYNSPGIKPVTTYSWAAGL